MGGEGPDRLRWHDGEPSVETIDPECPHGPPVRAIIPRALINRHYPSVSFENLRCVRHILEHPERIFAGTREHQSGGWCYVGRPAEWHIREGVVAPFPDHLVFAVYLNPQMLVYNWRAEEADPNDPLSPVGFEDRYGRLVWTRTS